MKYLSLMTVFRYVFSLSVPVFYVLSFLSTPSHASFSINFNALQKDLKDNQYIKLAQSTTRRPQTNNFGIFRPNTRPTNPNGRRPQTGGNNGRRVNPGINLIPGLLLSLPKSGAENDRPQRKIRPKKPKKKKVTRTKPRRSVRVVKSRRNYRAKQIVVVIAQHKSRNLENLIARKYRLRKLKGYNLELIKARVQTYRIPDRRSVESVLRQLRRDKRIISVQPNYVYKLVTGQNSFSGKGDLQYSHHMMRLPAAHKHATGHKIKIAIIDTGIDTEHPELLGAVASRHNSKNPKLKNFAGHSHGTAIAGIISANDQLTGVAPKATLLDAKAFFISKKGAEPDTDSYLLLRALEWSYRSKARIFNLSFAGPKDPIVSKYLKQLYLDGHILIAAAGNGGPKAKPAYPAAYNFVIATTALDQSKHYYEHANQGKYLSISAPGVDLMVLNTSKSYEFSSGTSLAAAHVSGLVALMLQHNPDLTQEQVKSIILGNAKDLGNPGHDTIYGAGLADAYSSIESVLKNKYTRN